MIQDLDRDEVSIHIEASPEQVYAFVSDVTRTPEYSPEVRRCTWLDGATGPAVGARFLALNKAGRGRWKNKPVITVAEPAREFAFTRTEKFHGTMLWRYQFVPEGTGTQVVESYEVLEPITPLGWFIISKLSGLKDRRNGLHAGIEQSLQRLRAVVEAERPRVTATNGSA